MVGNEKCPLDPGWWQQGVSLRGKLPQRVTCSLSESHSACYWAACSLPVYLVLQDDLHKEVILEVNEVAHILHPSLPTWTALKEQSGSAQNSWKCVQNSAVAPAAHLSPGLTTSPDSTMAV